MDPPRDSGSDPDPDLLCDLMDLERSGEWRSSRVPSFDQFVERGFGVDRKVYALFKAIRRRFQRREIRRLGVAGVIERARELGFLPPKPKERKR